MSNILEKAAAVGAGSQAMGEALPNVMAAFGQFAGAALAEGAVSTKNKELIAVGISVFSRCEYCIIGHARNALKAGCTRQEILEAAGVATAFGGGPASAYAAAVLVPALDEFEKEMQK